MAAKVIKSLSFSAGFVEAIRPPAELLQITCFDETMKALALYHLLLWIVILSLAPHHIKADLIAHEESGIEFWVPEDWQHEIKDDLLIVLNPEETVRLFFLTSGIQVLGQVTDALREEVSRVINQPEVTSISQQGENNQLLYYDAQGFGLYESEIVDWELRFIAGARKSLMIIALGDLESERQTIEEMYQTVELIKLDPET